MKSTELTFKEIIIGTILFFSIVLVCRIGWALLVYQDWKCAVADCRIIK